MVDKRYAAQIRLPEIGISGQQRLSDARVLCVGAGGLAAAVLPALVAAGVGKITLIDKDAISASNLNRQTLFLPTELGLPKVTQLATRLAAQNPSIAINPIIDNLTLENAYALINNHDLILDCCDDYQTKLLINDTCVNFKKPWIYASVLGWDGQVAMFSNSSLDTPCLRCYSSRIPINSLSCNNSGVLGASVNIVGSFQATLALQTLLQHYENKDKMYIFDLWSLQVQEFIIPYNNNCKHEQLINANYKNYQYTPLTTNELDKFHIIDIRTLTEWESGHLPAAQHVNIGSLISNPEQYLVPSKPTLIYCNQQQLSKLAVDNLRPLGFNVWWLSGGYNAYKEKQG